MVTQSGQMTSAEGFKERAEIQSDPTFLGLPREIRDKILTLLLVNQDVFLEDRDSSEDTVTEEHVTEGDKATAAVLPTTIGAILISEVELKNFNRYWKRSSYVRYVMESDDVSEVEDEDDEDIDDMGRSLLPTTYCLGSEVALQLFLVCRQIYDEALYIFYGKNRFYVNAMASLVPFLEDRPAAARKLIQMLSIPVPYGKQFLNGDCDEEIPRCRAVTNETFAEACTYLADSPDYLSNLKQLDLRIWDFHDRWNDTPLTLRNLKLSSTRMKQLASVASPQIMAVSLLDWHPLAYEASYQVGYGDLKPVIFARLPEHTCQKIQHCREGTTEGDEDKDRTIDSEDEDGMQALLARVGRRYEVPSDDEGTDATDEDFEEDSDGSDEDWSNNYEGNFQGSTLMSNLHGEL